MWETKVLFSGCALALADGDELRLPPRPTLEDDRDEPEPVPWEDEDEPPALWPPEEPDELEKLLL
jgi:hypothetical protein